MKRISIKVPVFIKEFLENSYPDINISESLRRIIKEAQVQVIKKHISEMSGKEVSLDSFLDDESIRILNSIDKSRKKAITKIVEEKIKNESN